MSAAGAYRPSNGVAEADRLAVIIGHAHGESAIVAVRHRGFVCDPVAGVALTLVILADRNNMLVLVDYADPLNLPMMFAFPCFLWHVCFSGPLAVHGKNYAVRVKISLYTVGVVTDVFGGTWQKPCPVGIDIDETDDIMVID